MTARSLVLAVACAAPAGCGRKDDPPPAITEPADPLAADAKAVPPGKAEVRLLEQPDPPRMDGRYAFAVLCGLPDGGKPALPDAGPGWAVVRVNLTVQSLDADHPDRGPRRKGAPPRGPAVRVGLDTANAFHHPTARSGVVSGKGTSRPGHVRAGAVLRVDRAEGCRWVGVDEGDRGWVADDDAALLPHPGDEMPAGFVRSLVTTPTTVAAPATVPLLQVGDRTMSVEVR